MRYRRSVPQQLKPSLYAALPAVISPVIATHIRIAERIAIGPERPQLRIIPRAIVKRACPASMIRNTALHIASAIGASCFKAIVVRQLNEWRQLRYRRWRRRRWWIVVRTTQTREQENRGRGCKNQTRGLHRTLLAVETAHWLERISSQDVALERGTPFVGLKINELPIHCHLDRRRRFLPPKWRDLQFVCTGYSARANKLQVLTLRMTIKPSCFGRDDRF